MTNESSSRCRACLHEVNNNSKSVFETYRKSFIYKYIADICDVQIKNDNKFPDKICSDCVLELDTAVKFRYKCQRTNFILHSSHYLKTELKDILKEEILDSNTINDDSGQCSPHYNTIVKAENTDCDSKIKLERTKYVRRNLSGIQSENDHPNPSSLIVESKKRKTLDLKLECNECGDFFKSKCKMAVHWKRVHLIQNLICIYCKREFKSIKAYNRHKNEISKACIVTQIGKCHIEGTGKTRVFYCNNCNYKSKNSKDIRFHLLTHTGEKPYECTLCNKKFSQLSSLNGHKEFIHKIYEMETTCQYCGKLLKGRRSIHRHLKQHESLGIKCEVCNKILKSKKSLLIHMQRHKGEKNYVCDKCPERFFSSPELTNHLRKHQDREKQLRFKCTRCKFVAVRKDQLLRHLAKHIDCNVPCTICGLYVDSKKSLVTHLRRHEEKKVNCSICGRKYQKIRSMRNHMSKAHNFRISEFLKPKIINNTKPTLKVNNSYNDKDIIEITIANCIESS